MEDSLIDLSPLKRSPEWGKQKHYPPESWPKDWAGPKAIRSGFTWRGLRCGYNSPTSRRRPKWERIYHWNTTRTIATGTDLYHTITEEAIRGV